MNITIRRISAITAFVLLISLLCSCGGDSGVRNDVEVATIAESVDTLVDEDGSLAPVDAAYIKNYMQMDVSGYEEFVVKINARGVNVDEYGIFKAKDADQAKEIAENVKAYLQMRNDTWMVEYMPEERPKMEAAEYKTLGNYVMYVVLWDTEKEAAFTAFEDSLKK